MLRQNYGVLTIFRGGATRDLAFAHPQVAIEVINKHAKSSTKAAKSLSSPYFCCYFCIFRVQLSKFIV